MAFVSRLLDLATGGSESPVRRLLVYYLFLILVTVVLVKVFPPADAMFAGERMEESSAMPQFLTDALGRGDPISVAVGDVSPRLQAILTATFVMIGALMLMLPVSWVYMAVRRSTGYAQSIVQTMLILPIVVAGVVLVVRNSLALAFSLAAIMAGVRFRNNLRDPRDTVFIFLAIAVGLAAGVQALTIAAVVSLIFNVLVLMVWTTDFGRSPLNLAPRAGWAEPLETLATSGNPQSIPDRDLLLSLTPATASALVDRFTRVRELMGGDGAKAKPRYNAVLKIATNEPRQAREKVEPVLESLTKRFRFDGIDSPDGKAATLWYLVRLRKKSADDVAGTVMAHAGDLVLSAEFEETSAEQKKQ